jgi:hypothetical protein
MGKIFGIFGIFEAFGAFAPIISVAFSCVRKRSRCLAPQPGSSPPKR